MNPGTEGLSQDAAQRIVPFTAPFFFQIERKVHRTTLKMVNRKLPDSQETLFFSR